MIDKIIEDYFVNPIIDRSGYNIINTLVYGIIAIAVAYFVYKKFKKKFTKELIIFTIPYILLGSTIRVITDAAEAGIKWSDYWFYPFLYPLFDSGIYNYSFFTTTPGIYIIIGLFTIFSLFLSIKLKKPNLYPLLGFALWLPNMIIVLSMISDLTYLIIILTLTGIMAIGTHLIMQRYGIKGILARVAVLSHTLDGVSSFVAIEIFNRMSPLCVEEGICYFGQHVVERFLSETIVYGTFVYLLLKLSFAIFASYIIEREAKDENERCFLYLLIIIFGLAPGIRNLLRITLGV
ncbi:MAG: DUF63 family protein [Candidatus Micrarchaeota archaeon]|nr:DUF63 family protein [Candidatus Micrarchaeota archaeon]